MDSLACNLADLTQLKSGVERLTLTDFRNYQHLRFQAEIAPIVVYGENGSGKTNILEAITILALTKSHRVGTNPNIIMFDKQKCKISGSIKNHKIVTKFYLFVKKIS